MNLYLKKNKLRYQAFYRGCKENELLFRGFFEKYFDSFYENDLKYLEEVVSIDDGLLLDYLYKRLDFRSSELYISNNIFKNFMRYCLTERYQDT